MFRYQASVQLQPSKNAEKHEKNFSKIVKYLKHEGIGDNEGKVACPFPSEAPRPLLYADFTASGRGLSFLEAFLREKVLPSYGNTHSVSTATARQSTDFRSEAREIIKNFYGVDHDYACVFSGSGATGGIEKLIGIIRNSRGLDRGGGGEEENFFYEDRWGTCECKLCGIRLKNESVYRSHVYTSVHKENLKKKVEKKNAQKNVKSRRRLLCFLDPVAHHSSLLPFRELTKEFPIGKGGAPAFPDRSLYVVSEENKGGLEVEVVCVSLDSQKGTASLSDLSSLLKQASEFESISSTLDSVGVLCVLSGASNVTGCALNISEVTEMVHREGAMVAWDLAAVAGHKKLELAPPLRQEAAVDFAFLSPHKFLGGPGSSGVLIAKKKFLATPVPGTVGGGVVFYVSETSHSYIQNAEEREEAGTPNILACIRTGLVYHVHSWLDYSQLVPLEERMTEKLLKAFIKHPKIHLLGPEKAEGRVGILSFNLLYGNRCPQGGDGLYLHYNFVSAVLNDLFGIQARGGCACAGPYAQHLLGMDEELAKKFEECLFKSGQEIFRPGFVRLGVHFSMTWEEVEYISKAVTWVAEEGWRLLGCYTFDLENGEWEHRFDSHQQRRNWISSLAPQLQDAEVPVAALVSSSSPPPLSNSSPQSIPTMHGKPRPKGDDPVSLGSLAMTRIDEEGGKGRKRTNSKGAGKGKGKKFENFQPKTGTQIEKVNEIAAPVAEKKVDKPEAIHITPEKTKEYLSLAAQCVRKIYSSGDLPLSSIRSPPLDPLYAPLVWMALPVDCQASLLRMKDLYKNSNQGGGNKSDFCMMEFTPILTSEASIFSGKPGVEPPSRPSSSIFRICPPSTAPPAPASNPEEEVEEVREAEEAEKDEEEEEVSILKKLKISRQNLFPKVPKNIRSLVGQAIREFSMIGEGDKVLIGLSGGKDSLTMLHVLLELQRRSPVRFEIGAATVDPQTPEYDPSPLIDYMKELGVTYHFLSKPLIQMAKECMDPKRPSLCSFCSRMKRGMLYSCMREHGYSCLALGQHLDDVAESFLMSAFHNGALRTMKANYWVQQEDIRVIRPLIFCREKILGAFAKEGGLPIIMDNCPACFAAPKERHRVKLLLSEQEFEFPQLFSSLLKTVRPLMAIQTAEKATNMFLQVGGGKEGKEGQKAKKDEEGGVKMSNFGPFLKPNGKSKSFGDEKGAGEEDENGRKIKGAFTQLIGELSEEPTPISPPSSLKKAHVSEKVDDGIMTDENVDPEELAEESLLVCNIGGKGCVKDNVLFEPLSEESQKHKMPPAGIEPAQSRGMEEPPTWKVLLPLGVAVGVGFFVGRWMK